jgi:hypothetical protein
MTIYVRPGIDPVAKPCRLRILLNPLKLMAKDLHHMSKMAHVIHPTLSLFKSNIFEFKKIYLIYKTLAQWCYNISCFFTSKCRQIVREMTRDNTLNIHVLITQSIPQDK